MFTMPLTHYQHQFKVCLVYMCSWGLGDWTMFFICSLVSRTVQERQVLLHWGKPISSRLRTSPPPTSPLPASSQSLPSRLPRSQKTCSAKSHLLMGRTTPVWWKWVKFPNCNLFSFIRTGPYDFIQTHPTLFKPVLLFSAFSHLSRASLVFIVGLVRVLIIGYSRLFDFNLQFTWSRKQGIQRVSWTAICCKAFLYRCHT